MWVREMCISKFGQEKGFTLAETMIMMSILLVVFAAITPLFFTAQWLEISNKTRILATSLADREMERVRSLPYDQVGVVGGNPDGAIVPDRNEVQSGINFHISTRVWWVDDSYDGTAAEGSDVAPNDYKKVQVTVTRQGDTKILAKLLSNIAPEYEEFPPTGGSIIVRTFLDNGSTPLEGVRIDVTASSTTSLTGWTDSTGKVLFAELPPSVTEGDYSISATLDGYVVRPDQTIQTTTVSLSQARVVDFILGVPGRLIVHLVGPGGDLVGKNSKIVLSNPNMSDVEYKSSDGYFDIAMLFPQDYGMTAFAASYERVTEPVLATVSSGQTTETSVTMQPKPSGHLHLEVFDYATGDRLGSAEVEITHVESGQDINASTNTAGILEIDLEAGEYNVEVSKEEYASSSDTIFIAASGNTNLDVYLRTTPDVGSILVKVQDRNGQPRDDIWIWVVGNGYSVWAETNDYGEALFDDLTPGKYTVYRWRGFGWAFPRRVNVVAGRQTQLTYVF